MRSTGPDSFWSHQRSLLPFRRYSECRMIQRRQQPGGADSIHLTPELRLILIAEEMTAEERQLPAIAGDGLNEEGAGQRDHLRHQWNACVSGVQLLHAQ